MWLLMAMAVPPFLAAQRAADGYAQVVARYRAGETRAATALFSKLDRDEVRRGIADLLKERTEAGRADLLAAGLLQLDSSLGTGPGPRAADFDRQVDSAMRLMAAADNLSPRGPDLAALRVSRAVALFMLDDVSGRDARHYAEVALAKFHDDGPLLLAAGAACETEGTGRWDSYSVRGRRTVRMLSRAYLRDARQYLQRASTRLPDPSEAEVHLAHLDVLDNDDKPAEARLDRLLGRNPPANWKYLALLQQSEIRLRAGEGRASLDAIQAALAIFPAAQSGLVTLSALLYQAGDRTEGARVTERLFARTSEADDPWWDYRFGHWKTAEAWLAPLRAEIRR
jgi:hypothetical protein